jgi:cysteine desulfurase / selenocysteine lyase
MGTVEEPGWLKSRFARYSAASVHADMRRRAFLRGVGGAAGGVLLTRASPPSAAASPAPQAATLEELRRARVALGAEDERFWRLVRGQFQLAPEVAYLNTAGLGASPLLVTDTVKAMTDREERAPSAGHSEEDWTRVRGKCAALLGDSCSPDEIALVSTATEGINLIFNGLALGPGDEVITSTHEHVALAIPLLHKMKTAGVQVRTFEPDLRNARGNVDRIEALIGSRTRLIFISHVTCTTGQVFPVADIGRLAASRRVFFALDGAQSLAQFPIDIKNSGADFFAASCHKWLLGPKRTGLFYIRKDRLENLSPSILGAYSDKANSLIDRRLELRPNAQRFEFGTQNDALIYGLEAAADFVSVIGLPAIWEHNRRLTEECVNAVRAVPDLELLSPAEPVARSAMVTFHFPDRNNREIASLLVQRRLRARSVTEGGLDAVRVSFHLYNEESEVEQLAAELKNIARR